MLWILRYAPSPNLRRPRLMLGYPPPPPAPTPQAQEYDTHLMHQKAVNIVLTLMKAARPHGVDHSSFVATCIEMIRFIDMPPKVLIAVLPAFVQEAAVKMKLKEVPFTAAFWAELTVEKLHADTLPQAKVVIMQTEYIVDKIVQAQDRHHNRSGAYPKHGQASGNIRGYSGLAKQTSTTFLWLLGFRVVC